MLRKRMTTLPFLLLALSPFVMSDSDYPLISCPLSKSKTLWDISMILGGNVEQDQTTCHVQNDNSAFLTFGVISLMSDNDYPLISCPLCKSKTFRIFLWYLVEM